MYTFPELSQFTILEPVKKVLINHLLEPFQSEVTAYWEASGIRLVIGELTVDATLNTLIPYLKVLARLLKLNLRLYVS